MTMQEDAKASWEQATGSCGMLIALEAEDFRKVLSLGHQDSERPKGGL